MSSGEGCTRTGTVPETTTLYGVLEGSLETAADDEPATFDATALSSTAADSALPLDDAAVGLGAMILKGGIVTCPVGTDALTGSSIEVVYPLIAIGTIGPGGPSETKPTDAGRLGLRLETAAAGPVTMIVFVSTLSATIDVMVTAGTVTVTVVVPNALGVGRTMV